MANPFTLTVHPDASARALFDDGSRRLCAVLELLACINRHDLDGAGQADLHAITVAAEYLAADAECLLGHAFHASAGEGVRHG
ncbi:hypothetical protein [Halotalea alkalilenta]|uniref:Uncharacterized protein n=1 Tax=Halotalea alkalilenta TaxID=376489 RepID=A0A172YAT3_9GAMM|nr:hypothetical protein [Halotalea alkalilenta]ANF56349.1 hypothetical protein A5892_01800 [Halotalea alkalilenta]